MSAVDDVNEWFSALLAAAEDHQTAIDDAYQRMENADLIRRVVVHRYICAKKGCKLATVIRVDGSLIARTEPNKLGPGMNVARTAEAARLKNTLDGNRHWPGHTFDVTAYASHGDQAGITMDCRCRPRTVMMNDVIAAVGDARPGHPGKPSRI